MIQSAVGPTEMAASHRIAIEMLAERSHSPFEQVERMYRNELTLLESHARVKQYLPLLTSRRVRELLRQSRRKAASVM
jgi:hypothetical protein